MESFAEAFKDQIALFIVVVGIDRNVLGEGLGGLVKLEAGEDMEGEALAAEGEEVASPSPIEEAQD